MSPKGGSFGSLTGGAFAVEVPLFVDDFTGVDGELLDVRNGWKLGALEGGTQLRIFNNSLASYNTGSGVGPTLYTSPDLGSPNHYTKFIFPVLLAKITLFVAIRVQDELNYVAWYLAGAAPAGARLTKVINGVPTDLISYQGVAGVTNKIEAEDDIIRIYQDDVQIGTDQIVTEFQNQTIQGVTADSGFGDNEWITYYEAGILVEPSSGGGLDSLSLSLSLKI